MTEAPAETPAPLARVMVPPVGGHRFAANALWNVVGMVAPMPLGVLAVPYLARQLGVDRFGVLTLAWAVIGYFSVFDLGLGRALVKLAAAGRGRREEVAGLFWTTMTLLLALGFTGGVVLAVGSIGVVHGGIKLPASLEREATLSLLLLALAMPALVLAAGPTGLLAAHGRFDELNRNRLTFTAVLFLGPAAVASVTTNLPAVIGVLAASRYLSLLAYLRSCRRVDPTLFTSYRFERGQVGPLVRFGGWMTVIQVVSPLMVTLDRFLVGALLSTAAVTYYATPCDVLTRLWAFPGAVVGVLFPAFAATVGRDPSAAAAHYELGLKLVFALLFPGLLSVVAFAPEGLQLWLGGDFPARSAVAMQVLAVGTFAYGLNHLPAELINAAGRPGFTARVRIAEFPLFLAAAWLLTARFGIVGASVAWTLRVLADTAILFARANRVLGDAWKGRRQATTAGLAAIAVLAVGPLVPTLNGRGLYFSAALLGYATVLSLFLPLLGKSFGRLGTAATQGATQ